MARSFERAPIGEEREVALRLLAAVAASLPAAGAVAVACLYFHPFVLAMAMWYIALSSGPFVARALGWRSVRRAHWYWLLLPLLFAKTLVVAALSSRAPAAWRLAAAAYVLVCVAGFALERRPPAARADQPIGM